VQSFCRGAKKYVVDVDEALLQPRLQQVPFDVNIHCDAKVFLRRLLERVAAAHAMRPLPDFSAWTRRVMDWKHRYDPVKPEFFQDGPVHPYAFMRRLSQKLDRRDVIVGDCGGNIVVTNHAFETKFGQRYFTNNGNSPMGFSFAGAMGAWFADPTRRVVCIIGDGGFTMNIQELQTVVNYGIAVKTFILNNHIYGITKAYQETNFEGRFEACGPKGYRPPDFVKVIRAYGIKTITVNENAEIDQRLDEVLREDGPVVCDVNIHEFHTYEPRIVGWETPIEDMYPYLPREEFRANMVVDPLPNWLHPTYPSTVKPSGVTPATASAPACPPQAAGASAKTRGRKSTATVGSME